MYFSFSLSFPLDSVVSALSLQPVSLYWRAQFGAENGSNYYINYLFLCLHFFSFFLFLLFYFFLLFLYVRVPFDCCSS